MILTATPRWGGVAAAVAGLLLVASAMTSRDGVSRFLDSVSYRVFDAAVLSAMAWALRDALPGASAAALLGLAGGCLAEYFCVRGRSLGYSIKAGTANRFIRCALVVLALSSGSPGGWLWTLAVFSLLTAVVRASQAFKEEMAT